MYRLLGLVLAGGLVLGQAAVAHAQVVVGNPWMGTGVSVGAPGVGFFPAPMMGTRVYSSGYSGFVTPGTAFVGTGYVAPRTFVTPVAPGFGWGGVPVAGGWGWGNRGWGWNRGWNRGWGRRGWRW